MLGSKSIISVALAFALLVLNVHAQNPGECPQDNGKYRTTSKGMDSSLSRSISIWDA